MVDPVSLSTYFGLFPDVKAIDAAASALVYLGRDVVRNDEFKGIRALERCHQLLESNPHLHVFLTKCHISKDFGAFEHTGA